MSAKAVDFLSPLGGHQHNQSLIDLDTSSEISPQQTLDLYGVQDSKLLDPIHAKDGNMK